ncbi:hypothetical protein SAMN05216436_101196 [bacterium A37T11]|nr:hypothetical protein SAMN05216436_101196 [bacterium A37T11]
MKAFKILFFSLLWTLAVVGESSAQCAMCTLNAENSVAGGNTEGKGLNKGILFLLATPYLATAVVGVLWYKRFRRKKSSVYVEEKAIHLN